MYNTYIVHMYLYIHGHVHTSVTISFTCTSYRGAHSQCTCAHVDIIIHMYT